MDPCKKTPNWNLGTRDNNYQSSVYFMIVDVLNLDALLSACACSTMVISFLSLYLLFVCRAKSYILSTVWGIVLGGISVSSCS